LPFTWAALEADPLRAVDLASLTGQDYWSDTEVEAWAMKSMAWSLGAHLLAGSMRGFIGADTGSGRMSTLVKLMGELKQQDFLCSNIAWQSGVDDFDGTDEKNPVTWRPQVYPDCATVKAYWEVVPQEMWYNANSGNAVQWLPVTLVVRGEEEAHETCEFDEYDYDDEPRQDRGNVYKTPDAVRESYSHRDYVRGVPRQFWRNG
jgi:hypothetical protein